MVIVQARSRRKPTGGRYRTKTLKKKYQLGRKPTLTKLGEKKVNSIRTIGGNEKIRLLQDTNLNISDGKKVTKIKVKAIVENPANRHFVRRNIMTKGTVIETEKGQARITSRPGQSGSIDAVLVT